MSDMPLKTPNGLHAKLRILMQALPPRGESWATGEQEEWLDLVRGVLAQIYPTSRARIPEDEPQ